MQLKSLQIQGFKSFPDKTKLEFSDGITAVVGPNGSGKSNISDAMRWVLGEQSTKTLRGGKMEDVIFVGTKERKQTGFASVELTVDNRDRRLPMDTDEITVCRKLYRSGDSEYRINNTSVRLKDVNELFMDTGLGRDGYCIIGQGKIAEIVDAKSVHRREIFEEAAGISKFRYRKEEAEKKLAASYENLVRLKDILLELEGRIEPLKVQSEKAEQFVKYANEKKSLEITLWLEKIEEFREKISQQEQILLVNRTEYEDNSTLLEDVEYQIGEVYKQIQQADIETEKIRERLLNNDSEISECNSKLAVAQNDILHNCNSVKSLADDIAMQQTDSNSLDLQIKQKQQEIADEKQKYIEQKQHNENILHKLNEIKIQEEQQTQKFAQLKNKYTATEKALNEQNLKKATSASLLEETKSRLSGMEQISQNQESILDEIKAEIKRCEDFVALLDENIASDTNALKGYEMKLASRNEGLNTLLGEQTKLFTDAKTADERRKMLLDMEKNMEGLDGSVKYVLRQAANGELRGIHGTVSKFISADSKIAVAIETALGAALQNIIVNDEYSAKAAMELLKKSNQGRATFLPLNAVKGKTVNEQGVELCEGYVGIAAELVKYEDKYKGIVLNLLGRTVIAEDVNCGISIAKEFGSRFKIVTLDGQVLNQGGSMTGGSVSQKAGILSRRTEIDRLSEKVNSLTEKADAMEDTIKVAKEHSDKISAQISAISGQIKTCNEDKITASAELKRYTFNYDDAVKNMKNVEKEYQSLKLRIELLSVETSDKDDIVKKLESEAILLSDDMEQCSEIIEKNRLQMQQWSEELSESRLNLLNCEKDTEALRQSEGHLLSLKENRLMQSGLLENKIAALQAENEQAKQRIAAAEITKQTLAEDNQRLQEKMQQVMGDNQFLEKKINTLRTKEKELAVTKERVAARMSSLEEKKMSMQLEYDRIISNLWDEYNLTRTQATEFAVEITDKTKAQRRLTELKNCIKGLGTVNLAAIEEYKEVGERYRFMKTQVDDVENSRNSLMKLIRELTGQMQEIFMEKFSLINHEFGQIFNELFDGGTARLALVDNEDILDCGIEIFVQPPGKIIKNLNVLSGGEKSFVSIAIYFAILKVSPSPFVLLDEIEAALDDVNVNKYAKYLRKLSHNIQFISITHRRGTMEEADMLYGVTMQEEGVSKLLKLDISRMESKLGIR